MNTATVVLRKKKCIFSESKKHFFFKKGKPKTILKRFLNTDPKGPHSDWYDIIKKKNDALKNFDFCVFKKIFGYVKPVSNINLTRHCDLYIFTLYVINDYEKFKPFIESFYFHKYTPEQEGPLYYDLERNEFYISKVFDKAMNELSISNKPENVRSICDKVCRTLNQAYHVNFLAYFSLGSNQQFFVPLNKEKQENNNYKYFIVKDPLLKTRYNSIQPNQSMTQFNAPGQSMQSPYQTEDDLFFDPDSYSYYYY